MNEELMLEFSKPEYVDLSNVERLALVKSKTIQKLGWIEEGNLKRLEAIIAKGLWRDRMSDMKIAARSVLDNPESTTQEKSLATAKLTVVAVLLGAGYTPAATHSTWADVSAQHVTGTNYAPVALSGKTSTRSGGTILWDCDDINFGSNVTVTAKYVAIVKRAGGALTTTDQLIGYCDLENASGSATVSSTNSVFQVNTTAGLFDL